MVDRRTVLKSGGAALSLGLLGGAPNVLAAQSGGITFNSNLVTVGNSLIDQSVDMVHFFTSSYGRGSGTLTHQTLPGAPFQWNWDQSHQAPTDAKAALRSGGQDLFLGVESVPFRHVQSPGDVCSITAWSDWYAAAVNGGVSRFFVFEAWPDLQSGDPNYVPEDPADPDVGIPWRERIAFSRQFYIKMVDHVNASKGNGPGANLVPGGAMFGQIHDDIAAGRGPDGLTRIEDLFLDTIHPNISGRYAMACLMYACLYQRDPKGLPVLTANIHGGFYDRVPPRWAAYFQGLAWEMAQTEPLTGFTG